MGRESCYLQDWSFIFMFQGQILYKCWRGKKKASIISKHLTTWHMHTWQKPWVEKLIHCVFIGYGESVDVKSSYEFYNMATWNLIFYHNVISF
jgi:hypothetical protein